MRGVSLEEIAETTKIGTRLLKALEEEQFDLLPGGIFNKGFVRAYAKYLGMDEEQAVADYLHAAGNPEPDVQLIAHQNQGVESRYTDPDSAARRGFPLLPVLILLLVVAGGFGGWRLYQEHVQELEAWRAEREASASQGPASAPSQTTPSAPVGSNNSETSPSDKGVLPSPTTSTEQPSTTVGDKSLQNGGSPFEVVVRTTGRAWVSLKADGKIEVRGILDTGQEKTLRANQEIVVWTGNAGATEVSFDGKPVPVEGGVNDARVLVFKPDGLQPQAQPTAQPAVQPPVQKTPEPSPSPQ